MRELPKKLSHAKYHYPMWTGGHMFLARQIRKNFALHKPICITICLEGNYPLRRIGDWNLTVWTLRLNPQAEPSLCSTYHHWVARIFKRDWCASAALKKYKCKVKQQNRELSKGLRAWLASTRQKDRSAGGNSGGACFLDKEGHMQLVVLPSFSFFLLWKQK